jgi:alkanesulfonate monooxygenase SsuD/methylene tetrahydromethanopterin reductase-like flavin-dependent oxidoreductase (luciferase family)
VISGGRAVFGLGAAWFEAEHQSFGFAFPPIGERMDRLDEALTIVRGMFAAERSTFEGRHYRVVDAINVPRPIQAGGPRILVGGGGEQRTLRIAARHADLTHWFPLGMDALRRKSDLLDGYCEAIGRDPAAIERTMATPVVVGATAAEAEALREWLPPDRRPHVFAGTPPQAAEALRPYLDAGFTGFTFNNNLYRRPEQIAVLGELLRLIGG